MSTLDHKLERDNDLNKVKNSNHPKKVVVAGPGTGKSFLFQELIKAKKLEGKNDFLAITFIGKLGDALADDLCGLAETMTMHGFARKFILEKSKGWGYYPRIYDVIKEDLKNKGIISFEIGDDNYKERSSYYRAVGDADVIYYAVQICKNDNNQIPEYDLILVDEFQDFNKIESEFIDLLSQKNEIVIVGDDDQALYGFKGSSPDYIRSKYDEKNKEFEKHTLRFCSRCTEVIIKCFHAVIEKFNLNEPAKNRIQKEYICYVPEKKNDSLMNQKIYLIKNCPIGMIAFKIKSELGKIISDQKIKEVLVLGEGRSCKSILESIAKQLNNYGFKNVYYGKEESILSINQEIIDAYKLINKDNNSLLGWRILGNPTNDTEKAKHIKNSEILNIIIGGTPSKIRGIKEADIDSLGCEIENPQAPNKEIKKELLFKEIKSRNINLGRPLANLNITVCNILGSKGLGADVVFVVGFDQGKIPSKVKVEESEIYQILVALTRAKKRVYLINTTGKKVSSFIDCLDKEDLEVEEIKDN